MEEYSGPLLAASSCMESWKLCSFSLVLTFPLSNSNQCSHLSDSGRRVLRNKPKLILITSRICRGIERIKYLTLSWGLFKLQSEKQHCKISLLCKALVLQFLPQLQKAQMWEPSGCLSRFTWKVLCGFLVILLHSAQVNYLVLSISTTS